MPRFRHTRFDATQARLIPFAVGHRISAAVGPGVLFLIAILVSGDARAQATEDDRTRYGIGAALLVDKDGYRDVRAETMLVPGVSIQNKWVDLFGPQLDLRLIGNESRSWWFGPRIEYRFDGYEQSDGAIFSGMSDRKGGLFYGVAGRLGLGSEFDLEVDYVRAATREAGFDRGAVASIQLSRSYKSGPWTLTPRFGVEHQSRRYVDYYYGVRASEATAARPSYAGRDTYSPEVGLFVRFRASPSQSVFANFNYERYAREIRNSPLMNSKGIPQVVLGYQFMLK
jgi:outer membrane protein